MAPRRDRFRHACAAVVGVLPGPLARVVAPSLVGFALVNGFTFAVDLLLLTVLVDGVEVPLGTGITVAYATAAFGLSFLLNRWLNFDPERPVGVQVVLFVAVVAVNYAAIVLGVTPGSRRDRAALRARPARGRGVRGGVHVRIDALGGVRRRGGPPGRRRVRRPDQSVIGIDASWSRRVTRRCPRRCG